MKITEQQYRALIHKVPTKPRKYRNVPIEIEEVRFDSTKEGMRWLVLRQMERDGEIKKLQRQVTFPLVVNGHLIARYRADFTYEECGQRIVEDSKGFRTAEFKMKKALMFATLGITIRET